MVSFHHRVSPGWTGAEVGPIPAESSEQPVRGDSPGVQHGHTHLTLLPPQELRRQSPQQPQQPITSHYSSLSKWLSAHLCCTHHAHLVRLQPIRCQNQSSHKQKCVTCLIKKVSKNDSTSCLITSSSFLLSEMSVALFLLFFLCHQSNFFNKMF